MTVRVIPRLDIKGPNLVKGIHLEGLRVLGRPDEFARWYYEHGADELIYIDVVASLFQRNSLLNFVRQTSREIFIPLTVGGGIRTIEDIRDALRAGADKVSINTAAVARPEFISEAASRFGSSTITVTIEAIRQPDGTSHAYTDNGREATGLEVVAWARRVAEAGAGEILLTSVDQDGTGKGYDLALTRAVADAVGIPVIASGGAGSPADVVAAVHEGHADAVAIASLLHYRLVEDASVATDASGGEGSTTFVRSGRRAHITGATLDEVKRSLLDSGIAVRSVEAGRVTHG